MSSGTRLFSVDGRRPGLREWFRVEGLMNFGPRGFPGGFCLSGLKADHLGEVCSASRERADLSTELSVGVAACPAALSLPWNLGPRPSFISSVLPCVSAGLW